MFPLQIRGKEKRKTKELRKPCQGTEKIMENKSDIHTKPWSSLNNFQKPGIREKNLK